MYSLVDQYLQCFHSQITFCFVRATIICIINYLVVQYSLIKLSSPWNHSFHISNMINIIMTWTASLLSPSIWLVAHPERDNMRYCHTASKNLQWKMGVVNEDVRQNQGEYSTKDWLIQISWWRHNTRGHYVALSNYYRDIFAVDGWNCYILRPLRGYRTQNMAIQSTGSLGHLSLEYVECLPVSSKKECYMT